MDTIFAVKNEDLERLSPQEAVKHCFDLGMKIIDSKIKDCSVENL